ncbi:hypothetical protein HMPREF1992_01704 [Selenomonas sp. oral taxon 892 str. F0426]|nr:hypothetical protein HMPREF1992_01704 [Selenomonas sp. oral taxon 892 str. F0426]
MGATTIRASSLVEWMSCGRRWTRSLRQFLVFENTGNYFLQQK